MSLILPSSRGGVLPLLIALGAMACHSEVVIGGAGGAGGAPGEASSVASAAGTSTGSSGSGTGSATGTTGSSTSGGSGGLCEHVVGQAQYDSPCDNSGVCGGVSDGQGCIGCALQNGCGEAYSAWVNQPELLDWAMCRSDCYDVGSVPEWACCFLECDKAFPAVGNTYDAFTDCTQCQHCPSDCGLEIGFERVCSP